MTTEQAVARAAVLMDETKPGWEKNINFKKLRMHNQSRCIAGQNGLDFEDLHVELWKRLGVYVMPAPFGGNPSVVPHWKREVDARLGKTRLRDKAMLALSAVLPF